MKLGGLFVGVDRQHDPDIDALTFAGRDAAAFWAAFADANEEHGNHNGSTTLLVGETATVGAVRAALNDLVEATRNDYYDVVVLHFSCHGTADGRLLLTDSQTSDVNRTSLSLVEIIEILGDLNAGCVIGIFESCFSGIAGGQSTDGDSDALRATMDALARGGNRAVVWAAGPGERAWETARLRHGILTHALVIDGLYGTLGSRDSQIDIGRWINDAVQKAEADAARDGHVQRPGRIVRLSSTPTMPRFRAGPRRQAQLLEDSVFPVRADLSGLESYGLDAEILKALRAQLSEGRDPDYAPRLTDLQISSISPHGALAGRSLIISGPTSCGKTLVGELAALVAAGRRLKTAFLLPMRALAAEKWEQFDRTYGPLGLRSVRSYGGTGDDDGLIVKGHFDVAFLTYEKFWLLALTNPKLLDAVGVVVMDEAHMITDENRGHVVELILTLLRMRRSSGFPIQILALSAALGDMRGFPEWLDATPVIENNRPVPLQEGIIGPQGVFSSRSSQDPEARRSEPLVAIPRSIMSAKDYEIRGRIAIEVAKIALARDEHVLIFRSAKWMTLHLARRLSRASDLSACESVLQMLGEDRPENDESRASRILRECLQHGVGLHISDLDKAEREVVEAGFRSGEIRLLVATSGLATGVNLPANTVIITDNIRGQSSISVSEYRNMAGRAGRWMSDIDYGTSYLVTERDADVAHLWVRFITGPAEPVVSRLSTIKPEDLALVLMLLSPGALTRDQLLLTLRGTLEGFQLRDNDVARGQLEAAIAAGTERLLQLGLVRRVRNTPNTHEELIEPTSFGIVCGRDGISAESAARIISGATLINSAGEPLNEIALIALAQTTVELDELWIPIENVETPAGQNELNGWETDSQLTLGTQPSLLRVLRESAATDAQYLQRLKRLNSISMWVRGKRLEEIENAFTLYVPAWKASDPAAGVVRGAAERTADVLRAVGKLVALSYPTEADRIRQSVVSLLPRLEHGVKNTATSLMRLGLGIRRGAAIQLVEAGIDTPPLLLAAIAAEDQRLESILTTQGLHRIRAILSRRAQAVWERAPQARADAQLRLFDRIGDATEL